MTVTAGGTPSKGTPADRRLKRNRDRTGRRLIAAARMARWQAQVARAVHQALAARQARVLAAIRSPHGAVTAAAIPVDPFDEATWHQTVLQHVGPVVDGVHAEIRQHLARMVPDATLPPVDFGDPSELLLSRFSGLGSTTAAALTDTLTAGTNAGEGIPALADRVRDVFDSTKARATMIARTEVSKAANGTELGYALAVHQAGMPLLKSWLDSPDSCDDCSGLADEDPVPVDQPFSSGDDGPPLHPNAVLSGSTFAAYGELTQMVAAAYKGPAIEVSAGTKRVTIGPNHPMLTARGLITAKDLNPGDQIVYDLRQDRPAFAGHEPDLEQIPLVEEAFEALLAAGSHSWIVATGHDFHGDRGFCEDEIQVVTPKGPLLPVRDPAGIEEHGEVDFLGSDAQLAAISRSGTGRLSFGRVSLAPARRMSGLNIEHYRLLLVTSTRLVSFVGYAFDATTSTGLYCSNGFVVKNCTCTCTYEPADGADTEDLPPDVTDAADELEGEEE